MTSIKVLVASNLPFLSIFQVNQQFFFIPLLQITPCRVFFHVSFLDFQHFIKIFWLIWKLRPFLNFSLSNILFFIKMGEIWFLLFFSGQVKSFAAFSYYYKFFIFFNHIINLQFGDLVIWVYCSIIFSSSYIFFGNKQLKLQPWKKNTPVWNLFCLILLWFVDCFSWFRYVSQSILHPIY